MLRLRDIMTNEVVTVGPDLTLRDAMDLLTSRHISGAPVVVRGKVVGVVSLTDLAECAAATPGVPTQRPDVAEWGEYENPADWIEGDEPPSAFFAAMYDDAGADVSERMAQTMGPEWNVLEEHTVGEAMNRKVASLSADTPVEHAAAVMQRAGIHRVLVMENGNLLGVVTTKDISDAVADHQLTKRVYVFDRGTP
jgi:CBS domain-containing protein